MVEIYTRSRNQCKNTAAPPVHEAFVAKLLAAIKIQATCCILYRPSPPPRSLPPSLPYLIFSASRKLPSTASSATCPAGDAVPRGSSTATFTPSRWPASAIMRPSWPPPSTPTVLPSMMLFKWERYRVVGVVVVDMFSVLGYSEVVVKMVGPVKERHRTCVELS